MSRIDSNGPRHAVDAFALAELFAQDAHQSSAAARDQRDAAFEAESALREQAVDARERAAGYELASGLAGGLTKIGSGVVGIARAGGDEAALQKPRGIQSTIEGSGQVLSSGLTFAQRAADNAAGRLDNRARGAQKAAEDARDTGNELRRIRDGQVDALRRLIEEETRTRHQIFRA